jgi:hypothetical protein
VCGTSLHHERIFTSFLGPYPRYQCIVIDYSFEVARAGANDGRVPAGMVPRLIDETLQFDEICVQTLKIRYRLPIDNRVRCEFSPVKAQ